MAVALNIADKDGRKPASAAAFRSSVAKLRESIATRARALPLARHAWARYRRRRYERRIRRFVDEKTGRADRLPMGALYEATMRCNLHCEFCYVGDLLNIEGQWRDEMTLDALRKAFPDDPGLQVSLTGGEIFMRKDIMSVLDLFREKGYACGYLTTNGTIITEERAEALAGLAAAGFLRHINVSIDGPGGIHDAARGLKGTFERTCAGLKRLQSAARRSVLKSGTSPGRRSKMSGMANATLTCGAGWSKTASFRCAVVAARSNYLQPRLPSLSGPACRALPGAQSH